jgi:tetratricopeptide (TPR) repeat protein
MSKLYDVISRLEDVAERDPAGFETPEPTPDEKTSKFSSPSVRILLLSLLFIVLGTLAVALTAWWQNWFVQQDIAFFPKDVPVQQTQQPPLPPKEIIPQPAILPDKNTAVHLPNNVTVGKTLEKQENIHNNQPLIIDDELLPDIMGVGVGLRDRTVVTIDDFLENLIFDQKDFQKTLPHRNVKIYIHELDIAEAIVELEPLSADVVFPTSQSTNINESKAKTSRWLHQAELYRHNGEWDGAIALYQRVWDISGESGVANNLAASLMQVDRPQEALKILEQAISIAPNDKDIKQNLTILKQILKQP